ncbi:hypothetical protein J132_03862 [Termitomyces sp. J132]|nr:hypothetical protein J132_03862 [Termitomyces sp. J132]
MFFTLLRFSSTNTSPIQVFTDQSDFKHISQQSGIYEALYGVQELIDRSLAQSSATIKNWCIFADTILKIIKDCHVKEAANQAAEEAKERAETRRCDDACKARERRQEHDSDVEMMSVSSPRPSKRKPNDPVPEVAPEAKKPHLHPSIAWIESKYGIRGIAISPYNSQANSKIERPHWNVRQAFLFHVMWSDCITIQQRFGCSPYFMVTGAHPTPPLDLVGAARLIELPEGPLSTEELIGEDKLQWALKLQAKALAKHYNHMEEMREWVSTGKLKWAEQFKCEYANTIKECNFKPKDLSISQKYHGSKISKWENGSKILGFHGCPPVHKRWKLHSGRA